MTDEPEWVDGVWRPPPDAFENSVDPVEGLDFLMWSAELDR